MAEDKDGNTQEYYKKELRDKLESYNGKIKQIFEDLTMKREELKVLNGKLNSLNEELVYYEKNLYLKASNKIETDNLTSLEETTEKQSFDDDHLLVYSTLKNRLIEISKSLLEVETIQSNKTIYNDEPIQFQCVCVLFVPDLLSPNDISYQTFRINHETKVYNLIESGLTLWDQSEKEDLAKLYFYESEDSWKFCSRNENVNNLTKNNKSTLKRAKFLLSINNFKPHTDDITQETNQNKVLVINKDQIDKNYLSYTRNFVGLAHYVQEKYATIKESDYKKEKEEKNPVSYYYLFFMWLNVLFLLLFFIFLVISNNAMSNPIKSYVENEILKSQFEPKTTINDPNDIIDYFLENFQNYFIDNVNNTLFKMINTVRFAFYNSVIKNCKHSNDNNNICYEAYYTGNPNYYDGPINTSHFQQACNSTLQYKFSVRGKEVETVEQNKTEFGIYLVKNTFARLSSINTNIRKTNIKGRYGVYNGDDSLNVFLSINYMNNKVLCEILHLIKNQKPNGINVKDGISYYFNNTLQRALVVDFALQNLLNQKYYYVSIVFEFSASMGYLQPIVKVDAFYSNLNEIGSGKLILITDIFRLIFSIYILLFSFYQIYMIYSKYTDKRISLEKLINKILTLETVCDIGIFIIEVMAFTTKINHLYLNTETAQEIFKVPIKSKNNTDYYYDNLPLWEYYPVMDNYQFAMMLEGFLMLFVLLRLLTFSAYDVRIRKFFAFMRSAFKKAFPYFLIILLFIFMFSIYAHNLWGERIESFGSYSSTFYFVLDFSFGLFQYIFNEIKSEYEIIFIFLFVGIVIFFFQSSLFGIYLESYRLNSLKKGNLYKARASKKIGSNVEKENQSDVLAHY